MLKGFQQRAVLNKEPSGSHLGTTLLPGRHLTKVTMGRGGGGSGSGIQWVEAEMLLNILQCTGQFLFPLVHTPQTQQRIILP